MDISSLKTLSDVGNFIRIASDSDRKKLTLVEYDRISKNNNSYNGDKNTNETIDSIYILKHFESEKGWSLDEKIKYGGYIEIWPGSDYEQEHLKLLKEAILIQELKEYLERQICISFPHIIYDTNKFDHSYDDEGFDCHTLYLNVWKHILTEIGDTNRLATFKLKAD